jgi:hypothetical protein
MISNKYFYHKKYFYSISIWDKYWYVFFMNLAKLEIV